MNILYIQYLYVGFMVSEIQRYQYTLRIQLLSSTGIYIGIYYQPKYTRISSLAHLKYTMKMYLIILSVNLYINVHLTFYFNIR